MRRLRPLSEAECYARCYGGWDETVRVVRLEPRRPATRSSWKARRSDAASRKRSTRVTPKPSRSPKQPSRSAVPDVLAPDLRVIFCGINPGRVSAAAAAHFANPRNDFWRLLQAAKFTSRLYEPGEQFDVLKEG